MRKLKVILFTTMALFIPVAMFIAVQPQRVVAQQSIVTPSTMFTTGISGAVASITKILSGISGQQIYITALALVPVATSQVTLSAGTGTNCGTGTVTLTGVMVFAAGQTLLYGDGYGAVIVAPSGSDVCITVATASAPGTIAWARF